MFHVLLVPQLDGCSEAGRRAFEDGLRQLGWQRAGDVAWCCAVAGPAPDDAMAMALHDAVGAAHAAGLRAPVPTLVMAGREGPLALGNLLTLAPG